MNMLHLLVVGRASYEGVGAAAGPAAGTDSPRTTFGVGWGAARRGGSHWGSKKGFPGKAKTDL